MRILLDFKSFARGTTATRGRAIPWLVCHCLALMALLGTGPGCNRKPAAHHRVASRKVVHHDKASGRFYYVALEKGTNTLAGPRYYWLTREREAQATEAKARCLFSANDATLTSAILCDTTWVVGGAPSRPQAASSAPDDSSPETQMVEVDQNATQENLGIPEVNSLDSMEGVPENAGGEAEVSSDSGSAAGESGGGDSGGADAGGGDSGGGDF